MFSPIILSQEDNIVSATKAIIEIHIAVKLNKKTTIRVHYKQEITSKLTVTSINSQNSGFY